MELVDFGSTGLRVSRLSFGTGTNAADRQCDQTRLGPDGLVELLELGFEHGVNFWDTADAYGTHDHVARALAALPRDQIVVATKIAPQSEEYMTSAVERILRELNADVLDIVLLHGANGADWPARHEGAMAALTRAKEQGKVRAVGMSCHSLEALDTAASTSWVDVVLARINFIGVEMDGTPEQAVPVIERLHAAGKAVYGMKVLSCGRLGTQVRAAIEYALSLGTVHALTIGMTGTAEVLENVRLVDELSARYPVRPAKQ